MEGDLNPWVHLEALASLGDKIAWVVVGAESGGKSWRKFSMGFENNITHRSLFFRPREQGRSSFLRFSQEVGKWLESFVATASSPRWNGT